MNSQIAPSGAKPASALEPKELKRYIVEHLDQAIEEEWIVPYYQPVVRTLTGRLCGMEALARWEDPTYGLLQPYAFIKALEEEGLIHKLDNCIINQVCAQVRSCLNNDEPIVPVSLNLSRLDFDLCDIHGAIERAVHENVIPRSLINIEITESVFGSDPLFIGATIEQFHKVGYQVWMDDFGSAYSSLNVLKDFDFDELKIDMEFLNRFGEKSRTIIASVVDMSKRLGIQTLAEGVETEEHSEFLRHIGCEKQQGYFFGKPRPYSREYIKELSETLGYEPFSERHYYHTVGSINTLSMSERDFEPDSISHDYITSMPLATLEYDGERFTMLDCNQPFLNAIQELDIPDAAAVEQIMNDTSRLPARTSRRIMDVIEQQRFTRHDYVRGGKLCVARIKFVARHEDRVTVLVTIDSSTHITENVRHERMENAFEALFSVYEHVDIIHLEEGYSEPVYSQASFKHVYHMPDLREATIQFAHNEIFPDDVARYLDFMNLDTMTQRLAENPQRFLVGFFRAHDKGGDYVWKLFGLVSVPNTDFNQVLVCVRDTNWDNDGMFKTLYDGIDDSSSNDEEKTAGIPESSLWRAIQDYERLGIFWKDKDRRFLGCNNAFLTYYGFESQEEIIGKTDEDMGWHVNPVPFMQEELKVLRTGAASEHKLGQCIVQGSLRDIVASKRPIYDGGHIVGLVGYFTDVTDEALARQIPSNFQDFITYIDPITGTLNYSGLDAATGRYIESYMKTGSDFSMIMLDIDNFKRYNDNYGYDFGDKVLAHAADCIRDVVGTNSVLGHIYADRFVILLQNNLVQETTTLGIEILNKLRSTAFVDGTPCTIYAHFGVVRFSECDSFDDFKRMGRERLHEARMRALDNPAKQQPQSDQPNPLS